MRDFSSVQENYDNLANKADHLENQSRRNNIIVDHIPESVTEKWAETEEKLRKILMDKMSIDHWQIELERTHTTGKVVAKGDKPRSVSEVPTAQGRANNTLQKQNPLNP